MSHITYDDTTYNVRRLKSNVTASRRLMKRIIVWSI